MLSPPGARVELEERRDPGAVGAQPAAGVLQHLRPAGSRCSATRASPSQSMNAKAQCDKGGPNVPDHGPGADWICVMSWHDTNVDETLMPGKFEINAHSNDCYTAGGPSKLVGLLTITDKNGKDVPNPAFEFDGCFDPHGSNKPTGVDLNPKTPQPTTPAALAVAAAALRPDRSGLIQPALTCSAGQEGCGRHHRRDPRRQAAPNGHLRPRAWQGRQPPIPAQPATSRSRRESSSSLSPPSSATRRSRGSRSSSNPSNELARTGEALASTGVRSNSGSRARAAAGRT